MKLATLICCGLIFALSIVQAQTIYPPQFRNRYSWYRPKRQTATRKAPVNIPVVLTPAEKAAKEILDRTADTLNRAEGVQFTGSITYSVEKDGQVSSAQTTAVSTLEREAKMYITSTNAQLQEDGIICADGGRLTIYDAVSNRYAVVTTSSDIYSAQEALELGGKQLFPDVTQSSRELRAAIGFPMIFFSKVYDADYVRQGETLTYSSEASTSVDGKPVQLVTETLSTPERGTVAATYMIDSASNLPLQFTQIETRPGKAPVTDLQETFRDMKLIHNALPASTYVVSLPAEAVLVDAVQ